MADTAEVRERARERDVVDVVAGGVGERTVLTPPGHAPVDELRVAGEAHVGPEPEALGHSRPEALDEPVGLLDHPQHRLDALGPLQVDGDAAPTAPVEDEPARPARGGRELGALDPHHLGAHVGEQRPRERTRADAGQLDHLHPVQRTHARPLQFVAPRLVTPHNATRARTSRTTES